MIEWPQIITLTMLVIPVLFYVPVQICMKKKPKQDVAFSYIGVAGRSVTLILLLHAGGFWG